VPAAARARPGDALAIPMRAGSAGAVRAGPGGGADDEGSGRGGGTVAGASLITC
jgi:hypothetical protein